MSKSLGNYFTLRDLLAKGFTGREVRYLLLTAHYRETFNFTLDGLNGAKTALARIDECVAKLRELGGTPNSRSARTVGVQASACSADTPKRELQLAGQETGVPNLMANFTVALDEDLNISGAWGEVFKWVTEMNRRLAENSLSPTAAETALIEWNKVDSVLGIGTKSESEIPPEILALAEARVAAKKAKDFKRADEIRDELKLKGWTIEDTPKGARLKKL